MIRNSFQDAEDESEDGAVITILEQIKAYEEHLKCYLELTESALARLILASTQVLEQDELEATTNC